MLGNIWKAHNSNLWQNNFMNGIQIHNQSPWLETMAIYLSKSQFTLAISKPNSHWQHQKPNSHWQYQKPNSHWQHQSPILIDNIKTQFPLATSKAQFSLALLYQKEKSPRLSTLGKEKKYHVKMLLWQKRIMTIILWRNSLRAILRIMFLYYEPMKYMDIILHHDIHNIYLLHLW